MNYRLKINYDTGDSFGSYPGQEETLELVNSSLEVAKRNAERIQAHARMYEALNGYRMKEKTLKDFQNEDWFVKNTDASSPQYSVILKTDEGKDLQIWASWCGYFETFNFVEVVADVDDMKFYK